MVQMPTMKRFVLKTSNLDGGDVKALMMFWSQDRATAWIYAEKAVSHTPDRVIVELTEETPYIHS